MKDAGDTPETTQQEQPGKERAQLSNEAKAAMRGPADEVAADRPFISRDHKEMVVRTYRNGDSYYIRAYDTEVMQPPDGSHPGQAGYANLRIEQEDKGVRTRLQDIKTTNGYKEKGVGSQMLGQVEAIARKRQAAEIYGDAPMDPKTIAWYGHRGYGLRDRAGGGREVFKKL